MIRYAFLFFLVLINSGGLALAQGAAHSQKGVRSQAETVPHFFSKIQVVTTFSILADFVREIGGERVQIVSLVAPEGDAHVYSPTPLDVKALSKAQLVFTNGLGFEGWINRLIKASGTKAVVVNASDQVVPLRHKSGVDPHAWQDVANAKLYVRSIADALIAHDQAGRDYYLARLVRYQALLDALDADIKAQFARIAPDRLRVITSHDAFGYFGRAYGVHFIALQGVSTEAEVSAKDVARIIKQIKAQRITAVFVENISDTRLINQIARETGARIGPKVLSDALSKQAYAATYIDMMRHNLSAFMSAFSS